MRAREWTGSMSVMLERLWEAGYSRKAIATTMKCHPSTVDRRRRLLGLPSRQQITKYNYVRDMEAARLEVVISGELNDRLRRYMNRTGLGASAVVRSALAAWVK